MADAPHQLEAVIQPVGHRDGSKQWADLVRNSSKPSSVFQLRKWPEEERVIAKEELRDLGFCLVAYILGRFPGRQAVENVRKSWNVQSSCSVHEKGWLIFRFGNEGDRDSVLLKGPYETFGAPWLMKKLPPFFKFNDGCFSSVPTWIRLQGLPLECWTKNVLGKLASFVGEPLAADECTATMSKTSFARILVEVDVTQPLVRQICTSLPDGSELVQNVLYEREPQICSKCKRIGHLEEQCRSHSNTRNSVNSRIQLPAQNLQTEQAHPVQRPNVVASSVRQADKEANVTLQSADDDVLDLGNSKPTARPQGAQLGNSAALGNRKYSIQDAALPTAETEAYAVTAAVDIPMVAGKDTRLHEAGTEQESKQTTNASTGNVQQQQGWLGDAASDQQKQGCQSGLLQPLADVQPGILHGEKVMTEVQLIEDDFPPLAAAETGRRKMETRKGSAVRAAAATAAKGQQQPDSPATDASADSQQHSASLSHQQDNEAATSNNMPQVTESEAGITGTTAEEQPKKTAEQDLQAGIQHATADSQQGFQQDNAVQSHQEDKYVAKVVSILYDKEPIVPNGFTPRNNWRHSRTTRSAKRRGY